MVQSLCEKLWTMLPQPLFRRNVEPCETGRSSSFTRTTRWGVSSDLGFGLGLPHEPTGCEKKSIGTVAARQAHEIPRPNHWSVLFRFLWWFFVFFPPSHFESSVSLPFQRWRPRLQMSFVRRRWRIRSKHWRKSSTSGRQGQGRHGRHGRKDWLPRLLETDWNWL